MSNRVEVILEFLYKNRGAVKDAAGDLDKLGKASKETGEQLGAGGAGAASMTDRLGALKAAAIPVAGTLVALGVAAKKAVDFIGQGMTLELTAQRFDTLAQSIGAVGGALRIDLREAAQGAASDMEIMQAASRLMAMGLVNSGEQLSGMVSMISRLKQPTDDLTTAMENFSLLIANRSILRLDSFNISGARTKEILEDMGVASAQAATDAEFLAAVMQAGQESMERMGVATGETTTAVVTLGAAWRTLMDEFKRDVAQGKSGGLLGALFGDLTEGLQRAALEKQLADVGIGIEDIRRKAREAGLVWDAMGSNAQVGNLFAPSLTTQQRIEFLTKLLKDQAIAQDELAKLTGANRSQVDDLSGSYSVLTDGITENLTAQDETKRQLLQSERLRRAEAEAVRGAAEAEAEHQAQLDQMAASEAAAAARAAELNAQMERRRDVMRQNLTEQAQAAGGDVSPLAAQIMAIGDAAGASERAIGALLIATGEFSEEAVTQAVKAGILSEALRKIMTAFFDGEISAKAAAAGIEEWQQKINGMDISAALGQLRQLDETLRRIPTHISVVVDVTVNDQTGGITWNRNGQTTQSNARGTNYFPGGWSWVGEEGPELLKLPAGTQIMSNPQSERFATNATSAPTFNVNVTGPVNRDDFRRIVSREVPSLMDAAARNEAARRRA